jgi:hypothetical protein
MSDENDEKQSLKWIINDCNYFRSTPPFDSPSLVRRGIEGVGGHGSNMNIL